MKFYSRKRIGSFKEYSRTVSRRIVNDGFRRIGKTSLLLKPTDGRPALYFSFYELVKIEHNNERIDWGILKKKENIFSQSTKNGKNCSVSYKGLLGKICNLEITLLLKSFVGLREEKPPISQ